MNPSCTSPATLIDLDACENSNRLRRVMSRCTHSNAVSVLLLVGVVLPLAGCEMVNPRAVRANKEAQPNSSPVTLDDMILKSIQRNAVNVDPQMPPNEAVAVLGVEGFGLRNGATLSKDETVYEFNGSDSRLIIRRKEVTRKLPPTAVGYLSTEPYYLTVIVDVTFEHSDSTRTRFAVRDSR